MAGGNCFFFVPLDGPYYFFSLLLSAGNLGGLEGCVWGLFAPPRGRPRPRVQGTSAGCNKFRGWVDVPMMGRESSTPPDGGT